MLDHETAVKDRYSKGAQAREESLCCAVSFDKTVLDHIPQEIVERDYGCGDPSRYVRPGDVVLDLGSGGGKICYIAAKLTGPTGSVIGVDWNDEMLDLAVRNRKVVAEKLGYANVEFKKGKIQDLRLDYSLVEEFLAGEPLKSLDDLQRFEAVCTKLRAERPLIPDNSIDLVVSNCVLNLVKPEDKAKLFAELFRVLKPGGRAAISDIVSDEDVPARMANDPALWSGCISGAFREDRFLLAFENVGFGGISLDKRDERPWQVVEGIEFRAATVVAYKPPAIANKELNQAAIYRGPWKQVMADDGTVLRRGMRMAVGSRTFATLASETYARDIFALEPMDPIDQQMAFPFDAQTNSVRNPKQSKCGPEDHDCSGDHGHAHSGGKCC
ncbi:MAG: methyltransferase domain-containing protein [Planctomycetota bacterium]